MLPGAFAIAQQRDAPLIKLDDAALLEALWRERAADLSVFDARFRNEVPDAQLRGVFEQAAASFGEVQSVTKAAEPNSWTLVTATHDVPIVLVRDRERKISGLLLQPPVQRGGTLDEALAGLSVEGADVAWVLTKDGETVASESADRPLAIGSTFKLWVLDAYRRAVEAGELTREQVVTLAARHVSWPSGLLQDVPPGLPLTLESVATLMMAQSDNTATDLMIDVLGRKAIEANSPFDPLLTTVDLFRLRMQPELEQRFSVGDAAERRSVLASLSPGPLPKEPEDIPGPLDGAEWYATPLQVCAALERVAGEPATRVPTGVVPHDGWQQVTDKPGGEPGVLSLNARLVGDDGTIWCLASIWNGERDADGRPRTLDELATLSALTNAIDRLKSAN